MYFSLIAVLFKLAQFVQKEFFNLYSLVGISFNMSLIFPTIYGIALKGLKEDDAKIGEVGLVMEIVESSLMPKFQRIIIDSGESGVNEIVSYI